MTKQHPLTHEIIEDLWTKTSASLNFDDSIDTQVMRVAYDLGESEGRAEMLKQGIKWLNDNVSMLLFSAESELGYRYLESLQTEFIQDFKQAMRPQEES